MQIQVRFGNIGDIEGIIAVAAETFPQDFNFGRGFSREQCQDFFLRALDDPNEFVVVVVRDDEVLGFIHYENKPPTNGTVYLNMIGVRKDVQGQGVGTVLLQQGDAFVVDHLRNRLGISNLATIWLSTSADNPVGQQLYLKCGYECCGEIRGMVGEGNIELAMVKKIADVKYNIGERWVTSKERRSK
ncbi:MAG: hypothetical protein Athens071424_89 [Parcubacteria group bacterium Athens0714_24]|nr:MAG: hypothetical protein Athens071424_89 [Parcubacteria group bacterium Athens0714_24]